MGCTLVFTGSCTRGRTARTPERKENVHKIAQAALSVCIVFAVEVMTQGATLADVLHPTVYELLGARGM